MNQQAIKILCFALAEYARIEAMKAANISRIINDESLAYTEKEFGHSANVLDQLAQEVIK